MYCIDLCLATNSARKLKTTGGILENPDRSLRFGCARTPLDQGIRQASAVHYNGVHYSAVYYIAVHYSEVHYSAVHYILNVDSLGQETKP